MWIGIGIAVVVVAVLIANAVTAPGRRRRAAVRAALDQAAAAAAARPGDLDAQVKLARVQLDLAKQPREALRILQAVVAKSAGHWAAGDKPSRFLVAHALVESGDLPQAIAKFEEFVAAVPSYEHGGDKEKKWQLETFKVEAEQRIRMLKKGDTHVHQPEQWGDANG